MKPGLSLLLLSATLVACGVDDRSESDHSLSNAQEPMVVCRGPSTLEGLDVAHYDGDVDWAQVAASGKSFAFAKATEGVTYTDPKFAQNWAEMKQNGVVRGAYHFFHANDDPIAQADFLLQTMGTLEPGDLPPTLDLEVTDGESASTIAANAIIWLDHVAQATGVTPILYSSKRVFTEDLDNEMGLDKHAVLWDAQWQVSCPDLPDSYGSWVFWQYTDTGTVPGLTTPNSVDLDTFNGTLADLQALGVPFPSSGQGGSGGAGSSSTTLASTGALTAGSTAATGGGSSANGGGGSSSNDSGSGCSCSFVGAGDEVTSYTFGVAILLLLVKRRARNRR